MTPGCTKQACDFTDFARLAARRRLRGARHLARQAEKLAKFRERDALTITLLSDPDRSVMTSYGAFGEKKLYGKVVEGVIRSTVVVDEDGKVEWRSTTSRPPATSPSCGATSGSRSDVRHPRSRAA